MDEQKLMSLLKQGEGPKLDYKEQLDLNVESGKKELVKDVIAIANSRGGRGHLLIGIRDKTREIIGIDPDTCNEERIQQIIGQRCDPPINVRVEFIEIDNKYVGIITIFRSHNKPHQMRQTGAFYIRRGSTTDVARRDEIASMLQNGGIISNEQMPVFNAHLESLDKELINRYLEKMNMDLYEDENIILNNLGIIRYDEDSDRFYPTVGGILLFCRNPQIYLPHTGIRLIYFNNMQRKIKYFTGNIIDLLDSSVGFIKTILKGIPYPVEALEECIANALVHRDYFDFLREIVIYIDNSKIEISNPGSFSQKESVNSILGEPNPPRRNNWLYQRLFVLDDKKRYLRSGLGLLKIKKSYSKAGRVKFLNLSRKNMFKVILPGIDKYKGKG